MGLESEFSVAALEVSKNGAVFHIFQALSWNCEFSGGWVAAELDSIVKILSTTVISHGAL